LVPDFQQQIQPFVQRVSSGEWTTEHALRQMRFTLTEQKNQAEPPWDPSKEVVDYQRIVHDWLADLERLVGLSEVKSVARELCAEAVVRRLRKDADLRVETSSRHMIFTGRPGTGKTTVARAFGQLFARLGLLSKGHLIELERADLVGEYIGQTAQKTRAQLDKAAGGILFVDEAYALARGGDKDFGREAIDTLVKGLEDRRDDLLVILAGYPLEMRYFLSLNPGLHSRFPIHVSFADFSDRELLQIADQFTEDRDYRLTVEARFALRATLRGEREQATFSNARTVRNVVERALRKQALRIVDVCSPTRTDLMTILAADVWGGKADERLSSGWTTGGR